MMQDSVLLIMAALWNRAGHYVLFCGFFFLSFFFFSSPILSRRRLDVYHTAGLKRAARGQLKYRTQKIAKNSPSAQHCTTLSGYIFAIKARIDSRNKTVK